MRYIFILSKEMPDLAKEEILTLLNINKYDYIENLLIIDIECLACCCCFLERSPDFNLPSKTLNVIEH